ncbi:MAG: phosphoglucomutase/phosphomannomutase family protein [Elusimicrobiota bacterium]
MKIKFGTDGWRGEMAREFTFDNVRRVAQAIAEYMKEQPGKIRKSTPVIIGYDNRFLSDAYAREISGILDANGLKVIVSTEPLPTPAISFLTKKMKAVGLMVTASHNPPSHNGIKIKLDGRAATEQITVAVESFLDRANPMRGGPGKVQWKSFRKDYLQFLRSQINPSAFARGLKKPVVIDYLYGSSGGLMGELVKSKKLIEIHERRDPLFGGINPEPIEENLKELKERVLKEKALLGIALDGDGDRFALVDDRGHYMTPCQVFPMIIEYLLSMRKLKGKIVQAVSMGYLAGRIAEAYGLPFAELPVGFKHVAEHIASGQAVIGGEESGGYAWKGSLGERDGMLTGMLFLEMCAKTKKTPSQLWALIEKKYGKSCFQRIDFRTRKTLDKAVFTAKIRKKLTKKVVGTAIKEVLDFDGIKVILEGGHWILMRPSGTEPLIRTYAESDSPKRTQALLDTAAKWVATHL